MTNISIVSCRLYFCPIKTRVPMKFGPEVTTSVVCARTKMVVAEEAGKKEAIGWGETPLSVVWVWPAGSLSYEYRNSRLKEFCVRLAKAWNACSYRGHPMEIGRQFIEGELKSLWQDNNKAYPQGEQMPWLAALVCNSLFDIAVHDAFGMLHKVSSWEIFSADFMNHDLSWYYESSFSKQFKGKYPADYLLLGNAYKKEIPVWHLVGGKDIVYDNELTGAEPDDGYPVKLKDWIERDGLKCLKIKLVGNDAEWDFKRLVDVGALALKTGVEWLTADFNCTVQEPRYVCEILDRLMA